MNERENTRLCARKGLSLASYLRMCLLASVRENVFVCERVLVRVNVFGSVHEGTLLLYVNFSLNL